MKLKLSTLNTLKSVRSIHQPRGFQSVEDVKRFWKRHGAHGFYRIKSVSFAIVDEIKAAYEKDQKGSK